MLKLVVDHGRKEEQIRGLYLITDHGDHLEQRVRQALAGGARVLQYRDKVRDYQGRLALGKTLKDLCAEFGAAFIVNDDLVLAQELDADGVHLGQDDGDPARAREVLGPHKLIGISTHNLEEALAAQRDGADYIGLGCIYPTASKEVGGIIGPEAVAVVRGALRIPVVPIGGITRDNAAPLVDAGADAVAVISSVLAADDPAVAAAELALLFHRTRPEPRGVVLTVAGSDSGGGAGVQGDLKTITLLGSYGASAITAVTAQNSTGVSSIHPVPPSFLAEQLDAVLSDLPVDVVKVGMLFSPENAAVLADKLAQYRVRMVITDTVMSAKGGATLLEDAALAVFKERLLPASYLVTPNLPEAQRLTGIDIVDLEGMERAARELHRMGARNVLVKGGHHCGEMATDLLFDGAQMTRFTAPRTATGNTHGTGCALASAIATFLAQGEPLKVAVFKAKLFITKAIKYSRSLGKGHGPVNHYLAVREDAQN